MRKHRIDLYVCFLLLLMSSQIVAQTSSPYSRYGLGFIRSNVFSANKGMGEISAGYASPIAINAANPASYSSLSMTTFEIGGNIDGMNIGSADSSYKSLRGSLSHVALGAPLKRGYAGFSIGLLPYSTLNYDFVAQNADTSRLYSGKGSLYKFYAGVGGKYKGFSLGVNFGYIFGKLDYLRGLSFTDSIYAFDVRNYTHYKYGGFTYDIGLQYQRNLIKKTKDNKLNTDILLNIGLTGNAGVKLNTTFDGYWDRLRTAETSTNTYYFTDTPYIQPSTKSKTSLPYQLGAGFTLGNDAWWLIGLDFKYNGWSHYSNPFKNDILKDSWRMAFGFAFTPNYEAKKKFFSRVQYKFGVYGGKNEVVYAGHQLNELGGTVGFTLPVPFKNDFNPYGDYARFHVMADLGTRYLPASLGFRETYYRITIGVTFNTQWFIKRKFD